MALFEVETRITPVSPVGGLTYGSVALTQWTDVTGDPVLDQYNRLNSQLGVQPFFYKLTGSAAVISAGISVQFACLINGVAEPDANLGGDLFFPASVVEMPTGGSPTIAQQAATSAVHNITVRAAGHYTFTFQRDQHGAKIVHLDVEAV